MTSHRYPLQWIRTMVLGGLASVLALVGLVAFGAPAFAHNNLISAAKSCASPLGTGYVVTWTISNDYNEHETGSVTSVTDGSSPLSLSTLSSSSFSIAASPGSNYSSTTITQTLPASTPAGTLTLNIGSTWTPDGYSRTDSGSFQLSTSGCAAPVQTIAGHIYLCNNSNPTTTEKSGGTLSANTTPAISGVANPLAPANVAAGTYTMTGAAPSGDKFVACGGSSSPNASGTSATESVNVPSGGAGVGVFFVTKVTPAATVPVVASPAATVPAVITRAITSAAPAASPDPTPVVKPAAKTLAFTGASLAAEATLAGVLSLLGIVLLTVSRRRLRRLSGND